MSVKVMGEAWKAPCDGNELLQILAMADAADEEYRMTWVGVKFLMERTHTSRATVYRAWTSLTEKKIIRPATDEERRLRGAPAAAKVWVILPPEEWLSQSETPDLSQNETPTVSRVRQNRLTGETITVSRTRTRTVRTPTATAVKEITVSEGWDDEPTTEDLRYRQRIKVAPRQAGKTTAARKWNASTLAREFRDKVKVAHPKALDPANVAALSGTFKRWLDEGVEPETILAMINLFVKDERYIRPRIPIWKSFLSSREQILDDVNRVKKNSYSDEDYLV